MAKRPAPRTAAEARAQLLQARDELRTATTVQRSARGATMRAALAAARAPCAAAVRAAVRPCARAKKKARKAKSRTQTLRLTVERVRTPREQKTTDQARKRKRTQREREEDRFHNAGGSAGSGGRYDDDEAIRAFVARKYKRRLIALSKAKKLTGDEAVSHYIHENRREVEAAHADEVEKAMIRKLEKAQAELADPDAWDDAAPRF